MDWPLKYLGMPVGCDSRNSTMWDPVIRNLKSRLGHWKKRYLSTRGRLTLIKFALSCMPLYFMSLFKVPIAIIKRIEKIQLDFFWNGSKDSHKLHLVSWNTVFQSISKGGLGIINIEVQNRAFLNK